MMVGYAETLPVPKKGYLVIPLKKGGGGVVPVTHDCLFKCYENELCYKKYRGHDEWLEREVYDERENERKKKKAIEHELEKHNLIETDDIDEIYDIIHVNDETDHFHTHTTHNHNDRMTDTDELSPCGSNDDTYNLRYRHSTPQAEAASTPLPAVLGGAATSLPHLSQSSSELDEIDDSNKSLPHQSQSSSGLDEIDDRKQSLPHLSQSSSKLDDCDDSKDSAHYNHNHYMVKKKAFYLKTAQLSNKSQIFRLILMGRLGPRATVLRKTRLWLKETQTVF
jgi:hypothetical protein